MTCELLDEIDAEAVPAAFGFTPHGYQQRAFDSAMAELDERGRNSTLVTMATGTGKAQPLDAKVLTPYGWREIGSLEVGDYVTGSDGLPTKVTGYFPQGVRPIYTVTFTDGAKVRCDIDHLWAVNTKSRRFRGHPFRVISLRQIVAEGLAENLGWRHFVPMAAPAQYAYEDDELPIDPYLLGVLLGDGSLKKSAVMVHCEHELASSLQLPSGMIAKYVAPCGEGVIAGSYSLKNKKKGGETRLMGGLRDLFLEDVKTHAKRIPQCYMTASPNSRLAVLRGLMDTDGHCDDRGHAEFCSVSKDLADGVASLVRSLGGTAKVIKKPTSWTYKGVKKYSHAYRMTVSMPGDMNPFRWERKASKWSKRLKYQPSRAIVSVEYEGEAEAACISVEAPDKLYVTEDYVVTHNTCCAGMFSKEFVGNRSGRVLFLAHRDELLEGAQKDLAFVGVHSAIEKAEQYARKTIADAVGDILHPRDIRCVVASVQSLQGKRLESWERDYFDLIITDECFPAGTLVDGRPIETIKAGEKVRSFNHETGKIELAEVLSITKKNPVSGLVRVNFHDGRSVICTPEHPFCVKTDQGYSYHTARTLDVGQLVFTEDPKGVSDGDPVGTLHDVQEGRSDHLGIQHQELEAGRPGLLLGGVQGWLQEPCVLFQDGGDEPEVRFGSDDREESDEEAGSPREDVRNASRDRTQAQGQGWERQRPYGPSENVGGCSGVADGTRRQDGSLSGRERIPVVLQDRRGRSGDEDSGRGGRIWPLLDRCEGERRQEAGVLGIARVDSVEVLEQAGNRGFGDVCPGGHVFNLEVDGNHNYFVEGILVHNCHHAIRGKVKGRGANKRIVTLPNEQYAVIYRHFFGAKRIGLTATPRRKDKAEMGYWYESIAFEYPITAAIADGNLVEIEEAKCDTSIDLKQVNMGAEDLNQGDLEDAISPFIEKMVRDIKKKIGERKTIIFCPGRKTVNQKVRPAEAFAEGLRKVGITATAVWGDHPDRQGINRGFREGEWQVVCNADLYSEGVNFPFVEAVVLASPTASPVVMGQRIGRGTRLHTFADGRVKRNCLVVTFDWQFDDHKFDLVSPYQLMIPDGAEDVAAIARRLMAEGETNIAKAAEEAREIADAERAAREAEQARLKAEKEAAKAKAEELRRARQEAQDANRDRMRQEALRLRVTDGDTGRTFTHRNPFASALSLAKEAIGGADRAPSVTGGKPATRRQVKELMDDYGLGLADAAGLSVDDATAMKKWLFTRYRENKATWPQYQALLRLGVDKAQAAKMSKGQAGAVIDGMKKQYARRSG